MMYNDDQCEECGAAWVSAPWLCVGCLKKRLDAERAENLIKRQVIESLKRKNEKLKELCERLLDHITSQSVYAAELEQERYMNWVKR